MRIHTHLPLDYTLLPGEKYVPVDVDSVELNDLDLESYYVGPKQPASSEWSDFKAFKTVWWNLTKNELMLYVGTQTPRRLPNWTPITTETKHVICQKDTDDGLFKVGEYLGTIVKDEKFSPDGRRIQVEHIPEEERMTFDELVAETERRYGKS